MPPILSDIPAKIPGLQIWLDANDSNTMTFSASNTLSQWWDKSSNANTGNPLLLSDSYKQGVFFNSALANMMRTTAIVPFTNNVITIFAIGNLTSIMNKIAMILVYVLVMLDRTQMIFYQQTINYNGTTPLNLPPDASVVIASVTPKKSIRFDTNISATVYSFNTSVFRGDINNNSNGVRGFIDRASYFRAYQNGINVYNTNTTVTYESGSPNVSFVMGQWNTWTLLGFIHEVIIFNRELSINEYQKIEAYLSWKYGYQKLLPSSHPYYWFPPN